MAVTEDCVPLRDEADVVRVGRVRPRHPREAVVRHVITKVEGKRCRLKKGEWVHSRCPEVDSNDQLGSASTGVRHFGTLKVRNEAFDRCLPDQICASMGTALGEGSKSYRPRYDDETREEEDEGRRGGRMG